MLNCTNGDKFRIINSYFIGYYIMIYLYYSCNGNAKWLFANAMFHTFYYK